MAEHPDEQKTPAEQPADRSRTWRPDGPGSFQAPAGVTAVTDRTGRLWTKRTTRWTRNGTNWVRWCTLVAEHGPVHEARRGRP
ncbi:hypothetical protein [Streptomyces sp. NPDC001068]|uniref:hypothetical protein n=1 Tax=Streptomyces sp. NPDC001068 TaxID=3364544 RepID=UPI003674A39E